MENEKKMIFKEKGYEKATIDDIASESELAKGTIYLYFTSKEEIYGGIILRGLEKMTTLASERFNKAEIGIEAYKLIGPIFQEFANTYPEYLKAFADYQANQFEKLVQNSTIGKEIEREKNKIVALLEEVITRGINDNSVNKTVDAKKVALLTMMTAGLFLHKPHSESARLQKNCPTENTELFEYFFKLMAKAIEAQ
jgi:AcrR family transcriptional regulator